MRSLKIDVALSLEDRHEALLDVARDFGCRVNGELRFVHAVTPTSLGLPRILLELSPPLTDMLKSVEQARVIEAEAKLRAKIGTDEFGRTEQAVLVGPPAEAIMEDARANDAMMIFAHAGYHSYKHVPAAYSTALRLMSEAAVPVAVIGPHFKWSPLPERPRILIADDLSDGSEVAVAKGFELAARLGDAEVMLLHVNSMTPLRLASVATELGESGIRGADGAFIDQMAVLTMAEKRLSEALEQRARGARTSAESRGARTRCQVECGLPGMEIARAAGAFEANIVVFGRHHWLRHDHDGLGKVPHADMLDHHAIVVVVPTNA